MAIRLKPEDQGVYVSRRRLHATARQRGEAGHEGKMVGMPTDK